MDCKQLLRKRRRKQWKVEGESKPSARGNAHLRAVVRQGQPSLAQAREQCEGNKDGRIDASLFLEGGVLCSHARAMRPCFAAPAKFVSVCLLCFALYYGGV